MKIGILTLFHGNDNWGGTLQGVALKKLLEREYPGAEVDLVDYRSNVNVIYSNKAEQAMQYGPMEIVKKSYENMLKRIYNPVKGRLKKRKELFCKFREPYLTNKHIYSDVTLTELEEAYDCLICGSDQIWNPNVARPGYFLKNIGDTCRKISYAASIARNDLSAHEKNIMCPLIEKFDFISVREKTAKNILQECLNKPVAEVLDPALMLTASEWTELLEEDRDAKECPYALAFFFSDSLKYRKTIEKYCENKNLKLIFIPFAAKYIRNDEKGEGERFFDVGPKEFLRLFKNATCIFTDSFHGSVFSIVFEKNFFVFERDANNKVSKNSRLYDLLAKFELSDRMVLSLTALPDIIESSVDYNKVNKLLYKYRKESLAFIREAIGNESVSTNSKFAFENSVNSIQKEDCCGCGLCAEICPNNAINMANDLQGFSHPIIDKDLCIDCGVCLKNCVEKNRNYENVYAIQAYIGNNKNENERLRSSSGGLFCELSKAVLKRGGVVYGAAFDEKWAVKHKRVDNVRNLVDLMTSKYVQSDLSDVFTDLKKDLKQGIQVLFSGTPCQIAAVRRLAKKMNAEDSLFLVDFICHGVPSPGIWKSYLEYATSGKEIHEVNFRDKSHAGWHDFYLHIKYGDNMEINESHELNSYMRTFLSDQNLRLSCYYCKFKDLNYVSDITLGDAWKIEKDKPEWADDKGTSLFLVRTKKGAELLNVISDTLIFEGTDYNKWTQYNPSIVQSTSYKLGRNDLFEKFANYDMYEFWKDRNHIPIRKRIRYYLKKVLKVFGLEKIVRQRR